MIRVRVNFQNGHCYMETWIREDDTHHRLVDWRWMNDKG